MPGSISLNGKWKLRWSDGQRNNLSFNNRDTVDEFRYIDANVPGEVHLDLMDNGTLPDIYRDANILAARWVEEYLWAYRKEFDATEEMLQAKHLWLCFKQLDLVATVFLNGQEVGRHANVFYPARFDVAGKLRPGRNLITVHIESGLFSVADKPYAGYDPQQCGKLYKRHWLRKPQCSFSWDWSQRLINVGITGDVHLEWSDELLRVDSVVPLVTVSDDLTSATVETRVFIEHLAEGTKATIRAQINSGLGVQSASTEAEIRKGLNHYATKLEVPSPELWWPVGHGAQRLYDLKVTVEVAGRQVYEKTVKIGFRHVRVNQDKHPKTGRYFIIEINRKRIFCKGGNFVPADMIFMRADRARYEKLTDLALESNFNMLRVWGGGMYETDDFYELCDEKGILVWQEFIFACCKYPATDEAFSEDIKREARYNVRRLAQHPSLIVWCGNNELEIAAWGWGYDKGVVYPDYSIYHLTLPRIMAEEDPTRYYQPSSPFSPEHRNPTENETGDQHPWFLGFFDTDFRKYRPVEPRFPNEGGTLGPTSLPTMLACLPEGQRRPHSFAWEIHENSIAGWQEPSPSDNMFDLHLGRKVMDLSVEQFTYFGGLLQGEGLREYCDSFRRKMFDVASAIFWMYNDTWPCVRSWTTVDYYLRRTPSFWSVKRSMQPLTVITAERGDEIVVYGVNERTAAVSASVRYGVANLAGGYPLDQRVDAVFPPNSSTIIATFPKASLASPEKSFAFAMLYESGKLVARHRLGLPLLKEMQWPKASVRVQMRDGKAVFTSDVFALGVCIDLDGEMPLADNFFDLYPGQAYEIPWSEKAAPKVLFVGNDM